MLEHGGGVLAAAEKYGIPPKKWLDLSTGINPQGFPVFSIPGEYWLRLPEKEDGLMPAAAQYYGNERLVAAAGSQQLIQLLPALREKSTVGVLIPSYSEHGSAWGKCGHDVRPLASAEIERAVDFLDVLVIANPNNPGGEKFSAACLLHWRERLANRGGWLVVDEAFIDADPRESLVKFASGKGLIVLRSLGKFFGLAGARVGFVFAGDELLRKIEEALGPWPLPGPSRFAATLALADGDWQRQTAQRLATDSARLGKMLAAAGLSPSGSTALFQWVKTREAAEIHEFLARRGILTRHFSEPASLRFGLPVRDAEWARLEAALAEVRV